MQLVAFLLGKPLKDESVFPEVFRLLEEAGFGVAVHLVHTADDPVPLWLMDAKLVVNRGLSMEALAAATSLEKAGVRCCNSLGPTMAVRDRGLVHRLLAEAGLPVPRTAHALTWVEAVEAAAGGPAVVKAADGSRGRGVGTLVIDASAPPAEAPFVGPYLVQERVPGDGRDRKLYVAGRGVGGLVKRWPRPADGAGSGEPFTPTPALVEMSHRVGRTLDLEVYGVDFVEGPGGPMIVDVNPFPSFKGVPGAARLIAEHLVSIAREAIWENSHQALIGSQHGCHP
ncbi:MAG: ATP-grasp domain-containing protein [Acidimicrobiia bacterium]